VTLLSIKIKRQKEKELLVFALCYFCLVVGCFVIGLKKKAFSDCVFSEDCGLKCIMMLLP
jgi:hypothetical protein